ncbi:MAG: hypothetical protein HOW73_10845 [Polyangiaceae bacterium]|nr:hypothetical protein [Polyangiaceae bacterium]
MAAPFANILHQETIRRLSSDRSFERGRAYFEEGRIRGLISSKGSIRASVMGASDYAVRIWVHEESLAYACTCPQGQEKAFCKHAVALGLAWLAKSALPKPSAAVVTTTPLPLTKAGSSRERSLRRALEGKSREQLVDLICALAAVDETLRDRILAWSDGH